MFRSNLFIVILFILAASATRLLPHPPNFSPILAISLFGGAYLTHRWMAALIPVAAMFISDYFLGFHDLMLPIYALMVAFSFVGRSLSDNSGALKIGATTISSSLAFFAVTNFLVWLTSGMYTLDFSGLVACFVMAVPFLQNQILGDLFFSGILFGGMYYLVRNRLVAVTVK
ncbi:MAG: hypothetical protein GW938_09030 [Leptospira sp.]|nr:hypothetical protein [Leptospira sp.]NCS92675.1 hypothetical protein [Leptospira sp.]